MQQSYKKALVVLGVYRGEEPWDIRPVFLNPDSENSLFLLRVINPGISIPDFIEQNWKNLPFLFADTYAASGNSSDFSGSRKNWIYWSLRRYCSSTLSNQLDLNSIEMLRPKASLSCISIIKQLKELEIRAAEHGHLKKSNIGIIDNQLVLLDPWYHRLDSLISDAQNTENAPDTLTVRSFASLFINLFGDHLHKDLIIALQTVLSSESSNPDFRQLFSSCSKVTEEIEKITGDSLKTKIAFNSAISDISISSNLNKQTSTNIAPSGRIISLPSAKAEKETNSKTLQTEIPVEVERNSQLSPSVLPTFLKAYLPENVRISNRALMFFIVAMLASVAVMTGFKAMRFERSRSDLIQLQEDWESDSDPRRRAVAQAALEDQDRTAQEVIELDFLSGNQRSGTNANFIKIAFNKLWREELNSEDELFAFSLALAGLYRLPNDDLPSIEEVHPGVLMALLGDLSLDVGSGKFSELSTEKFSSLPGAYGAVFSQLKKLGVENFSDISARAAARLITGAKDQDTFDAFISPDSNPEDAELRLTTIVPFCEMYPELSKLIITSLASRSDYLGQRIKWFVEDPIAQWSHVSENTIVYLTIGLLPQNLESFERTVDLLTFPLAGVRSQAALKLSEMLGKPYLIDILALIVKEPGRLSRPQTLGLLAAIRLPSDKFGPFLSGWLNTNPDPRMVLELLIASREQRAFEAVFVQLANYLARSEFELSSKDAKILVTHPESLARALAFPRLDPAKFQDREILEFWFKSEASPRLKEQLKAKLDASRVEQ